jgi:L,D-peptidoglycan transpeptidase YkuD (ErfK/YbiS/YcfS/YnhG family)
MKYVAKNLRNARSRPQFKPERKPERRDCIARLVATRLPGANRYAGRLHAGQLVLRCAIGGGGVRRDKREGDHASPAGSWRLLSAFYRPEKALPRPPHLPMRPIRKNMGWCDDPASPAYNRLIVTPFSHSHETLWRDDRLYDIVILLDYNVLPRRKQRGSAIFIHCAREEFARHEAARHGYALDGFAPTEGCVALRYDDLRRLLPRLSNRTVLTIR